MTGCIIDTKKRGKISMRYCINPVPKCRMTRRDKWLNPPRPCVLRYRAFADEVRAAGIEIDWHLRVHFYLPMPESWSPKKKNQMAFEPHRQKPDIDNLCKALMDAVLKDDSAVSAITAEKWWSDGEGYMVIY